MAAMAPLVEVRDLSVRFAAGPANVDAVSHVSFSVAKGEIVALVATGSGKTIRPSIMRLLSYPSASHPSGGSCSVARTC
jgi:ABC-type microcin C transport system duplicated ATPase subunit YejF